jgi:hypothetical protein
VGEPPTRSKRWAAGISDHVWSLEEIAFDKLKGASLAPSGSSARTEQAQELLGLKKMMTVMNKIQNER